MDPMILTLIVLVLIVIGFLSGKIAFGVVSICAVVILEVGGVLSPAEAWAGFSDRSVVLTVALFVLGGGFAKSSLITRMKLMLGNYKGSDRYVLWAIMGAVALLAVCTASNIAAATMIPIVISLSDNNPKLSRTRALKASGDMANIWTGTFPLGMAAGTYMLMNSMVDNIGGVGNFRIMDMTIAKILPVIACTIWQFAIGYKLSNKEPHSPLKEFGNTVPQLPEGKLTTLTPFQDKCSIFLFALSIAGMIFVSIVPVLPAYIVAIICALCMVFTGVLDEKQAFGSISWNIIFMYAGLLPLSTALNNSGAGEAIASFIQLVLGGSPSPVMVVGLFFVVTVVLTQFMSNTAVGMIFLVLAAATSVNMGMDPRAAMIAAGIGSTVSVCSPLASPAQTMIWGTGGYKMRDYLKSGLPLTIIFFVVYMLTAPRLFPLY